MVPLIVDDFEFELAPPEYSPETSIEHNNGQGENQRGEVPRVSHVLRQIIHYYRFIILNKCEIYSHSHIN